MDFKEIIDCIFINKDKYWEISDDDKEKNFFIINRKFSRNYPKIAQFFNDKNIDKPSSLDKWYFFFKNEKRIPQWYWGNKNKNKISKKYLPETQIFELRERLDLSEYDIKFLYEYYNDDLKKYLKKIEQYKKNS